MNDAGRSPHLPCAALHTSSQLRYMRVICPSVYVKLTQHVNRPFLPIRRGSCAFHWMPHRAGKDKRATSRLKRQALEKSKASKMNPVLPLIFINKIYDPRNFPEELEPLLGANGMATGHRRPHHMRCRPTPCHCQTYLKKTSMAEKFFETCDNFMLCSQPRSGRSVVHF